MDAKKKVLITGCSDESLGAALAKQYHDAGYHVYATARNPAKMTFVKSIGIETLTLDVLSQDSIAECVRQVPSLDVLVNSAGLQTRAPLADANITEAKSMFDTNFWAPLALTQAFLPVLKQSASPMLVFTGSIVAFVSIPFCGAYNSSKAALSAMLDALRLELQPFNIKVVELVIGVVSSNLISNVKNIDQLRVPEGSIYEPARTEIETKLRANTHKQDGTPQEEWAASMVKQLTARNPPNKIWGGKAVWLGWFNTLLPHGTLDGLWKQISGMDVAAKALQDHVKSTKL